MIFQIKKFKIEITKFFGDKRKSRH